MKYITGMEIWFRKKQDKMKHVGMEIGYQHTNLSIIKKGLHGRKRIINIFRMHMGLFMKAMASRSVNGAEHTSRPEQAD